MTAIEVELHRSAPSTMTFDLKCCDGKESTIELNVNEQLLNVMLTPERLERRVVLPSADKTTFDTGWANTQPSNSKLLPLLPTAVESTMTFAL